MATGRRRELALLNSDDCRFTSGEVGVVGRSDDVIDRFDPVGVSGARDGAVEKRWCVAAELAELLVAHMPLCDEHHGIEWATNGKGDGLVVHGAV